MREIEVDSFARTDISSRGMDAIRVVSWNINRGLRLNEIIDFLTDASADLILLQETDVLTRRTNYLNIPREIARSLQMNYVFGREFQELSQGRCNSPAYHGQATLSRFPLLYPRALKFRRQSAFWRPRFFIPSLPCFQRRLGDRIALICEIPIHEQSLVVYNVHLESRGNDSLRVQQLSEMLMDCHRYAPKTPILIAGDFNFDISRGATATLYDKQFSNPLGKFNGEPTVSHCRPWKSASIDWALVTRTLPAARTAIHDDISASDHYPLFLELKEKASDVGKSISLAGDEPVSLD